MSVNAIDGHISADKEKQILPQKHLYVIRWLESAPGFNLCDILPTGEFRTKCIDVYCSGAIIQSDCFRVNGHESFILFI